MLTLSFLSNVDYGLVRNRILLASQNLVCFNQHLYACLNVS